jgi:hypothetical protein
MKRIIKQEYLILLVMSLFIEILHAQVNTPSKQEIDLFIDRVNSWKQKGVLIPQAGEHTGKCGLGLGLEIIRNYRFLSSSQRSKLKSTLEMPQRQASKNFRHCTINYDTVGGNYLSYYDNVPSLLTSSNRRMLSDTNYVKTHFDSMRVILAYVDSAGKYFDYSWDFIVDTLGYESPELITGFTKYQVYITNISAYGFTMPYPEIPIDQNDPIPRYTSYIEIDNDFSAVYYPSRGIPALKVTAAHELHHAIQFSRYGIQEKDRYFAEITSTWMEDVVFNDVNDYYQYLPSGHFASPELSLIYSNGLVEYSRAIFGKFIQERYSPTVMLNTWTNIANGGSVRALDDALLAIGFNLRKAFVEFSTWNYYTGIKAIPGIYYSEAQNYPLIKEKPIIELVGSYRKYKDSLQTFSVMYLPVSFQREQQKETFINIITNINMTSVIDYTINDYTFNYQISTTSDESYANLSNGLFVKLDVIDPINWTSIALVPTNIKSVSAYPNPYIATNFGNLSFSLPATKDFSTTLYVYTSAMELIGSYEKSIDPIKPVINWDLKDKNGKMIASGIYIYVITLNGQEYIGKFAVVKK